MTVLDDAFSLLDFFSGAMENRTPIYDLQNHCNSRYTIAPFVARDGNDPSFFGRKPNVLPLDERAKYRATRQNRTVIFWLEAKSNNHYTIVAV